MIQLFCFADASHASLPNDASMQSVTLIPGKVLSRNGDFLEGGSVIDAGAKKIHRVCKSSLSAEVVALGTAPDLTLWTKVLVVGIFPGQFIKEIIDSTDNYALQTPFDAAPPLGEVKRGAHQMNSGSGVPETHSELSAEDMISTHRIMSERKMVEVFNDAYIEILKTFVFTDASNAYTSIMSGFPSTSECFLRINLSYIRDLTPLVVLTYIDKNYNLSDSGRKSVDGQHSLLLIAMQFNAFKFGFLGRRAIKGMTAEFEKKGKARLRFDTKMKSESSTSSTGEIRAIVDFKADKEAGRTP